MSDTAIAIKDLTQAYDGKPVVHELSLEVERGAIFGFIGPNGAGKTTTIRTLATLLSPWRGSVSVCGLDVVVDREAVRRKIGYMPDHAGVYERLTVTEYLEFFAKASNVADPSATETVLELVELHPTKEKLVATLSKGMRQRLQLARVLLHDPEVLILDEPASDLDPRARIEIRDLLLELRQLGKTIFLSSHILTELSDVCTSVGIIEKGRLLVSGSVGEITAKLSQRHSVPPGAEGSEAFEAAQVGDYLKAPIELTPAGVEVPVQTQRRLKLRTLTDAKEVRPLLEACPPIKSIESEHGNLIVARYVGDDRFVAELVRYLVSHGVGIVSVEPERNDLERVFLQVTKGEIQ